MDKQADRMSQFDRPDGSPIDPVITASRLLRTPLRIDKSGYPVIDEEALALELINRYTSGAEADVIHTLSATREGDETEEIVCDGDEE